MENLSDLYNQIDDIHEKYLQKIVNYTDYIKYVGIIKEQIQRIENTKKVWNTLTMVFAIIIFLLWFSNSYRNWEIASYLTGIHIASTIFCIRYNSKHR